MGAWENGVWNGALFDGRMLYVGCKTPKGFAARRLSKTSGGSGAAAQFAMVALRWPVGPSWRFLAHWASASLHLPLAALGSAPQMLSSDLATQGELSRRDKRRPPGGCAANPQKALRSKAFSARLPGRALGAREPWKPGKSGASHFFDKLWAAKPQRVLQPSLLAKPVLNPIAQGSGILPNYVGRGFLLGRYALRGRGGGGGAGATPQHGRRPPAGWAMPTRRRPPTLPLQAPAGHA